jgi:CheY-like chemotaxis protein
MTNKEEGLAGDRDDAKRLRGSSFSIISHDLRSPLKNILGQLNVLRAGAEGALEFEQQELLNSAINGCEGLLGALDRVVKLYDLKSGSFRIEQEVFNAPRYIQYGIGGLISRAKRRNISVTVDTPPGHRILADTSLFGELIRNLVSNSVKFIEEGGSVSVSIDEKSPTVVTVSDTGPGIDAALLPEIFNADVKTVVRDTLGVTGAGFGLPLCYNIMKAHGGHISITTPQEGGTVVTCSFPQSKGRVWVVDDSEMARFEIVHRLSALGVEISEFESGKEAIIRLGTETPQLIITDIMMPEIGGFELLEFVRRNPATETIPVIVVTASTDVETRDMGFKLGANDYLVKPIDQNDFAPRVKRFIAN